MKKKDITILLLIIIIIIQIIALFSTYSNNSYKPVSVKQHVSDPFCISQPITLDSIGAMDFVRDTIDFTKQYKIVKP